MIDKVMISLSGRNQAWFDKKSKKEQTEYLAKHPNSKFGKGQARRAKKVKVDPKAPKAKPAGSKKTIAKKAAGTKRPSLDAKPTSARKKKAASKKKPAPKKKPEVAVHKDTQQLHEHALKQKKAMIDKVIAPYARELGKLRTKRDSGGGLSNEEANRYKQLLATIAHLHKGRNS